MEEKEKLIQLVKKQIGIERELVKKIGEMEKKVGNAAAKMLLLEMRLDSQKHAGILTSILKVLRGVPPSQTIWEYRLESYVDPFVVKKELENHMKMETAVLTHVEEEIKQTKDEGLKLLLQHIADDEKKHHKILETIVKYSYKINP
ncbi:MAG: ferritin family protein [Candidatus Bathyarchaeia archaeon]|jgi:rubrerythrin